MTREIQQRPTRHLPGVRGDLGESAFRRGGDGIGGGPGDRVMELCAEDGAPRGLENRAAIASTRQPDQRRQRLGDPLEPQLDLPVPAFERRARAVHALQRPGVALRRPQLTGDGLRRRAVGRLEELVEPRDAERARGLEIGEQVAQAREGGMWRVMIGADEERDVFAGRALDQLRAHLFPQVR